MTRDEKEILIAMVADGMLKLAEEGIHLSLHNGPVDVDALELTAVVTRPTLETKLRLDMLISAHNLSNRMAARGFAYDFAHRLFRP
jgi:hypothetical protein